MRLGWDMTGYNGSCKCIYKWNIDIHTVLYTDDVHILYIIHVRKILSYLVLCFVMLCPASLQLRCHFFVLVAICLGPQSTESLKPWGQDRQGHDIYLYAYLPQRKKNVRSCSYMNLIWWHLGTRHIISKFKYDNLTKAWQYVVKKGPWVKQTEIHDDSCRWDVDPLLKPSIIQIG